MTLFRKEAFRNHASRLTGEVSIATPIMWQNIGYALFAAVTAGFIFLLIATYSRVETVTGAIVPDKGVTALLPPRGGTIQSISVGEGQYVSGGTKIMTIRSEEDSENGISAAAQVENAIMQQDLNLASQISAIGTAAFAQLQQIEAQTAGTRAEIAQLHSQIALQQELIATAQNDYDRAREVAKRGFISGRDLQVREETLLARKQGLAQLNQTLEARKATLVEAERNAGQIAAQAKAQRAGLSASRAQVAQQAASTAGSRSYVLRAPVAGRVTALTARVGQIANPQIPVVTIIPAGSKLQVELFIPSSSIGFVKPGQEVRLAIDAFPYQRFGTITGRILIMARSPVTRQVGDGRTLSAYPVTVTLDRTHMTAFGRQEKLIPGMTLTARIITEKQSLFRWLFEPLFAVRNR